MRSLYILSISLLISTSVYTKLNILAPLKRSNCLYKTQSIDSQIDQIIKGNFKHIQINIHDWHNALLVIAPLKKLKNETNTITLKVPEYIATILTGCPFIDQIISSGDAQADYTIDIEDLYPHIKDQTISDYWLKPDDQLASLWEEVFIQDNHFKIGVCCQSLNGIHTNAKIRTKDFLSIASFEHISVFTFDTISAAEIPDHIRIYSVDKETKKAIGNVLAIIEQLDLVITTDAFIAQLAGALNKETWFIDEQYKGDLSKAFPSVITHKVDDIATFMHQTTQTLAQRNNQSNAKIVSAEIATGELIDKITILEIKTERIDDELKLENIWRELQALRQTFDSFVQSTPELNQLIAELKSANEALWDTEDLIRDKEREKCFDDEFIRLARSVYIQNDARCQAKRKINELVGSRLMEEKSYKPYN